MRRALMFVVVTSVAWVNQTGLAVADNCGSPSDCFFSQRAAILALIAIATLAAFVIGGPGAALVTFFVASDVATAVTGRDPLTWEKTPRWVGALGLIDPTPGNVAVRGGTRVVREVGEEIVEEGGERAAREGAEEIAEEAGERSAREGAEEAGERAAREGAENAGPGSWGPVRESMSDRARAYQEFATGSPSDRTYTVFKPDGKPVKFEGFENGTLIDAKGPEYDRLLTPKPPGSSPYPYQGVADDLVKTATRQLEGAQGMPIEWRVMEEGAVPKIKAILADADITGIRVVHYPMP